MNSSAPVSEALLANLRSELQTHPVLVWLDRDAHYSGFVDELRRTPERFPALVLAHRGSYLETMLELQTHGSGIDPSPLLLHLPAANEDSVKQTPFLETYSAGYRFRKSLSTLIYEAAFGRVPREEVDAFLEAGDYSLESADAWMAQKVRAASGELDILLGSLSVTQFMDQLLASEVQSGALRAMLGDNGDALFRVSFESYGPVWAFLGKQLGLDARWPACERLSKDAISLADISDLVAGWTLCVEYVHDLRGREPVQPELVQLTQLARPLRDNCCALAQHLRRQQPEFYVRAATLAEGDLKPEKAHGRPEDLGRVDTFRFEEEQLLRGALNALGDRSWQQAEHWATDRLEGGSFWLQRDASRRNAWLLVRAMARLALAIESCKLDFARAVDLGDAAGLYQAQGSRVDRLHRHLEQLAEALLYRGVPHYAELRTQLDAVRELHRQWSNGHAIAFSRLCEEYGALPGVEFQQRRIFEDVVLPLLDDKEKTALFLVDALRFEMAEELLDLLGKASGAKIRLDVRLAELPTITEVGMNVLAPVADGTKLRPVLDKNHRRFEGFLANRYQVTAPKDREKAIRHRAGGDACPWKELDEILGSEPARLKASVGRADRLLVVHSLEIDAAGEKGAGPSVFEGALRKLERALAMLHEAGIRRFVVTSDHGFLLRRPSEPLLSYGKQNDPLPRYVIAEHGSATPEHLAVALRSLDYQGTEAFLFTPRGTAVHERYDDRTYVHGGNSPQERVIPVLTIRHRRPPGADVQRYAIEVHKRLGGKAGMHGIEARVVASEQMGLAFTGAQELDVDIRVVAEPGREMRCMLCQTGPGATMEGGVARVPVGRPFELYFRITGRETHRARIELFHPGGHHQVEPMIYDERFDIDLLPPQKSKNEEKIPAENSGQSSKGVGVQEKRTASSSDRASRIREENEQSWLSVYEDEKVRRVFAHIEAYGSISEQDATTMLGGARQLRRFSRRFEEHAAKAPFLVRIDIAGASKIYAKEGQR